MVQVAAIGPSQKGDARVAATGLSGLQLLLMGLACAVCVANNYYSQPLLVDIARDLGLPSTMTGLAPTLTQVGIAAGMLFLLPMGDRVDNRRIVVALLTIQAATLIVMATTDFPGLYFIAAFTAGLCGIATYLLPAFATRFVSHDQRGRVTGALAMGIMLGIAGGRSLAGILAYDLGWRGVYAVAALVTLAMAAVMKRAMPRTPDLNGEGYGRLLASLGILYRETPLLRLAALLQMLSFGVFSALWVGLSLRLQAAPFLLDTHQIGMLSLVAITAAITAPALGRLVDRNSLKTSASLAFLLSAAGWMASLAMPHGLTGIVAAITLIGIGALWSDIALRGALYRLDPAIRMRLNAVYSTATFVGGSLFSFLTPILWTHGGWTTVAGLSLLATLAGLGCSALLIPRLGRA